MKIRKARIKDLNEINEIYLEGNFDEQKLARKSKNEILENSNKSRVQRLKGFKKSILSRKERVLVCEENDNVIGFGIASLGNEKRNAEISLVYLKKEYRKKGIASKIVKELLKWLKKNNEKKVYVSMDKVNKPSINLHKKFGFKESVIIMEKKLK